VLFLKGHATAERTAVKKSQGTLELSRLLRSMKLDRFSGNPTHKIYSGVTHAKHLASY